MVTTLTIRFKGVLAGFKETKKRYKASDHLRAHVARFSKSSPELVSIDPALNDFMMSRVVKGGSKVKIEVTKNGDILNAKLAPGQMAARQEVPKDVAARPAAKAAQKKEQPKAKAAATPKPEAKESVSKPAERPKKEAKKPTPQGNQQPGPSQ